MVGLGGWAGWLGGWDSVKNPGSAKSDKNFRVVPFQFLGFWRIRHGLHFGSKIPLVIVDFEAPFLSSRREDSGAGIGGVKIVECNGDLRLEMGLFTFGRNIGEKMTETPKIQDLRNRTKQCEILDFCALFALFALFEF